MSATNEGPTARCHRIARRLDLSDLADRAAVELGYTETCAHCGGAVHTLSVFPAQYGLDGYSCLDCYGSSLAGNQGYTVDQITAMWQS